MSTRIALLLQKAVQDIQGGNFKAAVLLLNETLEIEHQQVDALRLLGVIAALQKDWHQVLQLIDQVIQLNPQSGVAHSNRGNIFLGLGKVEEALISYEKAIALGPLYAEAHNNELTHKSWTPNPTQRGQSHVQIQQRVQASSYSALFIWQGWF
jgi:tetratricopeptide (TPR) repeat protein